MKINQEEAHRELLLIIMIALVSMLGLCAVPFLVLTLCLKSSSDENNEEALKKAKAEAKIKKE